MLVLNHFFWRDIALSESLSKACQTGRSIQAQTPG
jgi:hypothetical protein